MYRLHYVRNSTWDLLRYADHCNLGTPPRLTLGNFSLFSCDASIWSSIGQLLTAESRGPWSQRIAGEAERAVPHRCPQLAVNYSSLTRKMMHRNSRSTASVRTVRPIPSGTDRADCHARTRFRHNFNVSAVFNFIWGLKLNPIPDRALGCILYTYCRLRHAARRKRLQRSRGVRRRTRFPGTASVSRRSRILIYNSSKTSPCRERATIWSYLFLDVFNVTVGGIRNFGSMAKATAIVFAGVFGW